MEIIGVYFVGLIVRKIMRGSLFTILVLIFMFDTGFGQGKIMLAGGGSEDYNSWSDAPYRWAVEQSANKKVAVISYATETSWIPEYFVSLGAAQADNIRINSRALADQMYDSLMQYDVFFFKGGDQYNYYRYYKDTQVADAINDKFQQGGVIAGTSAGMAILSGVIFTAEKSSIYPDEGLSDFKSSSITLADDFSELLPGFIVDSHFTERGRIGRLLAFIANWHFKKSEWITGIGVDDRTALCIDASNKASVFGTGSVSFYKTTSMSSFQDDKPITDSVAAIQLLHGHSIQLPDLTILEGPEDLITPSEERNTGTYSVLLSGSESIGTNNLFLNEFINHGSSDDSVVVVTASGKGTAFIARLQQDNVPFVLVETKAANNSDDQRELRDAIRRSKKVLFVDNDDNALFNFLDGGKTGALIRSHVFRNNILSGFVGEDSRYAGKVFVTNHLGSVYAAYYGDLVYRNGLNLLSSSVVMSDTYAASTSNYYENTTAAVSFALVNDALRYGIYLNRGSYLRFAHDDLNNYFEGRGEHSAMILVNEESNTALASEPVNTAGDVRNYVGFSSMYYVLLNGPSRLNAGSTQPSVDPPYEFETIILSEEESIPEPVLYPNPTTGVLYYNKAFRPVRQAVVVDTYGRSVVVENNSSTGEFDLSSFPDGIYVIRFADGRAEKIMISH